MGLKVTEKRLLVVHAYDLDMFVFETYGRRFEFVGDWLASRADRYEFLVTARELTENEAAELLRFQSVGDYEFLTTVLLVDLCNRGLIEPGDYLVTL